MGHKAKEGTVMAKKLSLVLGIALLIVGLALTAARAAGDTTTQLRPVHCGPVLCWQHKIVTTHVHGLGTRVVTYGHHRPVESRNLWHRAAFSPWTVRAAHITPGAGA
jgi:hypothetical protein